MEGHISRDCRSEMQNSGRRDGEQNGGGQLAEIAKQRADMAWQKHLRK